MLGYSRLVMKSEGNETNLGLDEDDLYQIAKFLDALLEADMTNKNNERKKDERNNYINPVAR